MKREIKQTKKAVSQRAYYLRKKEKAEAKRADDDKAILDLVAYNAKLEARIKNLETFNESIPVLSKEIDDLKKERDELKVRNSETVEKYERLEFESRGLRTQNEGLTKSRNEWRETARKFEKSAKQRLVWAYVWAFSSISGSVALAVSLTGGL